jgi:hypothetical protein
MVILSVMMVPLGAPDQARFFLTFGVPILLAAVVLVDELRLRFFVFPLDRGLGRG